MVGRDGRLEDVLALDDDGAVEQAGRAQRGGDPAARSSAAALVVKVRPRTSSGRTLPVATSHTTRCAIRVVLPLPAPATTTVGRSGAVIAAHCSSLAACVGTHEGAQVLGGVEPDRLARLAGGSLGHWTVTLPAPLAGQMATNGQSRQCGPGGGREGLGADEVGGAGQPGAEREPLGPGVGVGGLGLHLGGGGVVVDAELDELGAAGGDRPSGGVVERAGVDGVLVERELEVAGDRRAGGRRCARS